MLETISIKDLVASLRERADVLRGYLDLQGKTERLEEVNGLLEDPKLWDDPEKAQELGKERQSLSNIVDHFKDLYQGLDDVLTLDEMATEENSEAMHQEVLTEMERLESELTGLELERMFSGPNDNDPCYMDIQSGSGGTEAQDWAEMVMRMYIKFAEKHDFKVTVTDLSEGEVAGIKSATLRIEGDHAYGWFRTETGVHRLVRKSPFDSNNRRHTSFCSAYVYPEIDDNIEISINPADLKTDVFRASGAGGQHINKTESAVRITHIPTGIVVSCQNERSQFQNRDQAMKQLRARLYTLELEKRQSVQKEIEDSKSDIGWGSQIRSYVLDDARIKDLRTGVESRDTQKVLNGDLE
ncbi:MAG: peptide chain release factor 2, partial [Succinivibrio sp.]